MTDDVATYFYDLETTGLFGRSDILLTCTFKRRGARYKPFTIGNVDCPEDFDTAIDIAESLKGMERIIGWNTHGFDLKFLNDRLRANGQSPLLHRGSFDLKEYCKKTYPYIDGHQDSWLQAIGAKHQKTPLDIEQNRRLGRGEGSIDDWKEIVHHNVEDVLGLEEIYDWCFPGDES
jgi:uncharacterized protein YprB with RNaseH-like and TPR domain